MKPIIEWLRDAPWPEAVAALLAENLLILVVAVIFGEVAVHVYRDRRVALAAESYERLEIAVAVSSVFLNTVVTIVGLFVIDGDSAAKWG